MQSIGLNKMKLLLLIPGYGRPHTDEKSRILQHNLETLQLQSQTHDFEFRVWLFVYDDTIIPDEMVRRYNMSIHYEPGVLGKFMKLHVTPDNLRKQGFTHVIATLDDVEWRDVDVVSLKRIYDHHQLDIAQPAVTTDTEHNWPSVHYRASTLDELGGTAIGRLLDSMEWLLYFMDTDRYATWWELLDVENPWCYQIDFVLYAEKKMRLGLIDTQQIKHYFCDHRSLNVQKWDQGVAYIQKRGYKTATDGKTVGYIAAVSVS